ncbi:methyltransferase [Pseudonocardia xinjiangensis]|uniref:methyltransferase n=1 Tax=Pseudonocardia xinjiangensis TaxID=75289 RepID=UPI003D90E213
MTDVDGLEEAGGGTAAEMAARGNTMLQMITGYWVTQILRAAADLSVTDHVADGAATAEEVAARARADPSTTYRLMRACVSIGVLEYEAGRFSVTPLGTLLRAGVPGSLREMALVQGAPGHWTPWMLLPEAVRAGRSQANVALGTAEGTSSFDYFALHPEEGRLFAESMANVTAMVIEDVIAVVNLAGVSVAVDVGGAHGELVHALMQAAPGLKGVVLDRPEVVPGAVRAAETAGVADRFSVVSGDFFAEVAEADLYLLKMILHDWDDDACRTILRNCRASARPGARALVVESVVGDLRGPSFAAILDMNMLATTLGQERELGEFDALYTATGWRRTGFYPTRAMHSIQELEAV